MKLAVILSVLILTFVVLLAKFINYSTHLVTSDRNVLRSHIAADMLTNYSMRNAVTVNTSLSCKNGPVRPQHETFHDGILSEIKKTPDPELPECKLMDIRSFVVDNFAEDTNGTL